MNDNVLWQELVELELNGQHQGALGKALNPYTNFSVQLICLWRWISLKWASEIPRFDQRLESRLVLYIDIIITYYILIPYINTKSVLVFRHSHRVHWLQPHLISALCVWFKEKRSRHCSCVFRQLQTLCLLRWRRARGKRIGLNFEI